MKLNLGCGDKKLDGYINVDSSHKCKPDYVWDVCNIPYPKEWTKNVERIEADNLVEHLPREQFIPVMNEWHRILKEGGVLWIKSPAIARNMDFEQLDAVFGDPTHTNPLTERTFTYWDLNDKMRRWHLFGKDYGIEPFIKTVQKNTGLQMVWELKKQ